jgi:mRNA interferase RelE/StbE
MRVEWTDEAIGDMAALETTIAQRVRQAIERFAATGFGDIKRLHGFRPPEFRMRVGGWRVRFQYDAATMLILRVRNRREAYR